MNKVFVSILLAVAVVLFTGCNSCNHSSDAGTDAQVKDVLTEEALLDAGNKVVYGETWQIELLSPWHQASLDSSTLNLIAIYEEKELLFTLGVQDYEGTYDQFAIESLRAMRGEGFVVEGSATISHGCDSFVGVNANKEGVNMMLWLSVIDGKSYKVACGGKSSYEEFDTSCQSLFDSLEILKDATCHQGDM